MTSTLKVARRGIASVFLSTIFASNAFAVTHTIDFDLAGITHGTVIDTEYQSIGVTISANNPNRTKDYAVAYDSTPGTSLTKSTDNDTDLTGPNWGNGNIASSNPVLGNVLIIQETSNWTQKSGCSSGKCNTPDDEGTRPAGDLIFDFDLAITEFGMDLIDVEGPTEYGSDKGYVAAFFSSAGSLLGSLGFGDFISRDGAVYGNNSVNRISPIDFVNDLGITSDVQRVVVNFGGSAAIDNILFSTKSVSVSEPEAFTLFGFGAFLIWLRRRNLLNS